MRKPGWLTRRHGSGSISETRLSSSPRACRRVRHQERHHADLDARRTRHQEDITDPGAAHPSADTLPSMIAARRRAGRVSSQCGAGPRSAGCRRAPAAEEPVLPSVGAAAAGARRGPGGASGCADSRGGDRRWSWPSSSLAGGLAGNGTWPRMAAGHAADGAADRLQPGERYVPDKFSVIRGT